MEINLAILILAIISAIVPVVFWFFILRRKGKEKMISYFFLTFFLSGMGAVFIFYFEIPFQNFLKAKGLSLFAVFIILGTFIEYFKNIIVRISGFRYFKNIDDVMDLSFASALGFTFFENIFHFYMVFSGQDPEVIGPVKMVKYFLTREFFILPIHLFCSGIFGYFYAMGIFASRELQINNYKNFIFRLMHLFLRFFFIPKKRIFKVIKIMQGTIVSVFFYALFFTLLEYDPKFSDIARSTSMDFFFDQNCNPRVDERLMPIISFAFFKVGTVILFNLMDRKRRFDSRNMLKTQKA